MQATTKPNESCARVRRLLARVRSRQLALARNGQVLKSARYARWAQRITRQTQTDDYWPVPTVADEAQR